MTATAPLQSTADLVVEGLVAGYGPITVLRGIDLEVPPGTVVALLGPNGAGKTTLVRALAGLIRTRRGSARMAGTELAGMPAHARARRGLVTVTDDRGLFPDLTVLENLRLGAALADHPRGHDLMGELAERFPAIAGRGDAKAGLLSGGEQQMLALAKALAARPSVLLLDEPSQGLAPTIVKEVGAALRTLRDEDLAVLIAEQNVDLVADVADRYAVLAGGRVVDQGPVSQLDRTDIARRFLS